MMKLMMNREGANEEASKDLTININNLGQGARAMNTEREKKIATIVRSWLYGMIEAEDGMNDIALLFGNEDYNSEGEAI
jgi:hypothetical protein